MLLAAYCCEGHQIVAHAIAHGAVPVHAAGFDTLLYFAVQELIRSLMPSPTKRFILRPHDDGVVLYCLSHGNQHCVVAAPREPERAFAAFGFLADLHARGGAARSEQLLLASLGHFSAASLEDDASLLALPHLPPRAPAPLPADLSERLSLIHI